MFDFEDQDDGARAVLAWMSVSEVLAFLTPKRDSLDMTLRARSLLF